MRSRALQERGPGSTNKRLLLAIGLLGLSSLVAVNYVAFLGPHAAETSTTSLALREKPAPTEVQLQHTLPSMTSSAPSEDVTDICPQHVVRAGLELKYDCSAHFGPGERLQCCCQRQSGVAPKLGEPAFTCLPSLVIAGAQKSGTTALVGYLLYHPELRISKRKEFHVFDQGRNFRVVQQTEGEGEGQTPHLATDWHGRTHLITATGLQSLLRALPSLPYPQSRSYGSLPYTPFVTIDASPSYMLGTETAARIYATIPNTQVVVLLRDPVARAYSEWNMKHRRVVSQVRLQDEEGMRSLLRPFIHCVSDQSTATRPDLKEATANDVLAWWKGTQVDPPPPSVLARRCMSKLIRGPHLKYIMHMGRSNDGRTAEEVALSTLMAILAPKAPSQMNGKGLVKGVGNIVKRLGRKMTWGGRRGETDPEAQPGAQAEAQAEADAAALEIEYPVYQACDDSGACLGPIYGRLKEGKNPVEEESTLSALYSAFLNLPHTPGLRQPAYESVADWDRVAEDEARRLTACSAEYPSAEDTLDALMRAVRLRTSDLPSTSLSAGIPQANGRRTEGGARHIIKDGTDACWKQGSDSNISKDFLYRSMYVGQIMRLYAAFRSSLVGLSPTHPVRAKAPLVFTDNTLRATPQVVLDGVMAGTGLSVYAFTDISQSDLDKALDAAFPAFENNGWMLDSRSSPLFQPMADDRLERLQRLYAPYTVALLDVLAALGVKRQVLEEVASWLPVGDS